MRVRCFALVASAMNIYTVKSVAHLINLVYLDVKATQPALHDPKIIRMLAVVSSALPHSVTGYDF
jgi:hypothetical protein